MLTNPRSGGNRRNDGRVAGLLAARLPAARHVLARTAGEIEHALDEFRRAGIDLLVINGGDGTVQAALTHIYAVAAPGSWRPDLALLRAGTASMLARDAGLAGSPPAAAAQLAAALTEGGKPGRLHVVERHVLRVEHHPEKPPQCGMFFGCGAVCRGIDLCHGSLNRAGIRGELMPGLIMLRQLIDLARGRPDRLGPVRAGGMIDARPLPASSWLLIVAATLRRLVLGMYPFWGTPEAPLHLTAIETRAPHLLRRAGRIMRGRPDVSMTPAHGFHSAAGKRMELDFTGDFTLDGEIYTAAGSLTATTTGPARFLVFEHG
ncbi:MAG: hypothetical protein JW781_00355 [Deltaproteobacteria bacterium]|nr:hypothetical protein [Candidatus Anaeroferrophillacea bacterium]